MPKPKQRRYPPLRYCTTCHQPIAQLQHTKQWIHVRAEKKPNHEATPGLTEQQRRIERPADW